MTTSPSQSLVTQAEARIGRPGTALSVAVSLADIIGAQRWRVRSRAEHWPRDTDTVMEPAIHTTATRHIAPRTTAPATGTGTVIRPTEPMATHLMAIPTPTLHTGGVGGGGKGAKSQS